MLNEIVEMKIKKHLEELQPVIGRFDNIDAPFLLFAIDAYRAEIVKRIPEAEKINEELKRMFGVTAMDRVLNVGGKNVKYTFKKGSK